MGTLITGGLVTLLQNVTNGILTMIAQTITNMAQSSAAIINMPWVTSAIQVMQTVAISVFTVKVAWEALSRYVLWNEGNADTAGANFWKGSLRVAMFGAASFWLASNIFNIGVDLGNALMLSAPMNAVIQSTQNLSNTYAQTAATVEIFCLAIFFVTFACCLVIIMMQQAIMGAELVFFVVAGPVMALGQFNPDGGVWNNWWRGLLVLGMSQAWRMLGLGGTVAILGSVSSIGANGSGLPQLFLAIAMIIVTIRGPHFLKEWAYHTGAGGAGMFVTQTLVRSALVRNI